ncbi:unnamed protein product [Closterium sp. Naga37s-1]|nr:unnamed protein product [Closterium sp. Naga37s-1]
MKIEADSWMRGEEDSGVEFPSHAPQETADSQSRLLHLPGELLSSIVARVAASASCPGDIANLRLSCRTMRATAHAPATLAAASSAAVEVRLRQWCPHAHQFLRECCEAGNAPACHFLGMVSFYCLDLHERGMQLLARAAMAGHAPALYSLAVMHFNASGPLAPHPRLNDTTLGLSTGSSPSLPPPTRSTSHPSSSSLPFSFPRSPLFLLICLTPPSLSPASPALLPFFPVICLQRCSCACKQPQRAMDAREGSMLEEQGRICPLASFTGTKELEEEERQERQVEEVEEDWMRGEEWEALGSPTASELLELQVTEERCPTDASHRFLVDWHAAAAAAAAAASADRCAGMMRDGPVQWGVAARGDGGGAMRMGESSGAACLEECGDLCRETRTAAEAAAEAADELATAESRPGPFHSPDLLSSHLHSLTPLQSCSNPMCGRKESRPEEFRCCAACGEARYCSRGCQTEDWAGGHQVACTMLAAAVMAVAESEGAPLRMSGVVG